MSGKDAFIKIVQKEIFEKEHIKEGWEEEYNLALTYFNELKSNKTKESPLITENGAKIVNFMKLNKNKYNNAFKAKDIGEGLFCSSRSISGSMRKLISDGFVEKIGKDPVTYAITDKGFQFKNTIEK